MFDKNIVIPIDKRIRFNLVNVYKCMYVITNFNYYANNFFLFMITFK